MTGNTLVVKGNVQEVSDALYMRGIEAVDIKPHAKFNECIVLVSAAVEWAKLTAWFCEGQALHPITGFPAGTLLWYGPISQ